MTILNPAGEVANFVNESQFEGGESAYECGFFTVYLNAGAGQPPAGAPRFSGEEVDQLADAAYKRFWGNNLPSDKQGMSLYQLHLLLTEEKLFYPECVLEEINLNVIRGYLSHGYGVILCVKEDSIFDLELGDRVPYAWKPSGNHIITACGFSGGDTLLCRDTASIAPDGVRPGPRRYDAGKLNIINATAVVYPWLPRPGAHFDPLVSPGTGRATYVIQPGDTLTWIAVHHDTTVAHLLSLNQEGLNQEAQKYGYSDSRGGNLIFPGYELTL